MVPSFLPGLLVWALLILVPTALLVAAMSRNMAGLLAAIAIWAAYYAATYSYKVGIDRDLLPNALALGAVTGLLLVISFSLSRAQQSHGTLTIEHVAGGGSLSLMQWVALVIGILSGIATIVAVVVDLAR
jgi:hypothetical protein